MNFKILGHIVLLGLIALLLLAVCSVLAVTFDH